MVDHVSSVVLCDHVINTVVAFIANWGRTHIILKIDGSACKEFRAIQKRTNRVRDLAERFLEASEVIKRLILVTGLV